MRIKKPSAIIMMVFLCCLNKGSHANEVFSFAPYFKCKLPPRFPSSSVLGRQYQTYISVGKWHIYDINGDGWCDWVRNGRQGYRSDIEVAPMSEMIYLGTPTGWRNFETMKNPRFIEDPLDSVRKIHLWGFGDAYGFYQPIPIYRKGLRKPFVVAVSRIDAPAPPPNIESIDVLEWDDDTDNLRYVSGARKDEVINFLKISYCNRPSLPLYDGEESMIAMGDLCEINRK